MKMQRLAMALTVINLVILTLALGRLGSTATQAASPIVRASTLELVDDRGQVRSRFAVGPDGEVVLRLFDQHGTIRVKLGAGDGGSGLLLMDETTEPGVHIVARREGTSALPATTSVTLLGADGRQRAIRP